MGDTRQEVAGAFDRILEQAGFTGLALVTRDGRPALMRFNQPVDAPAVSAMFAAGLAACETAMMALGPQQGLTSMTAESANLRVIVQGLDDQYLLVIVGQHSLEFEQLSAIAVDARQEIAGMLNG